MTPFTPSEKFKKLKNINIQKIVKKMLASFNKILISKSLKTKFLINKFWSRGKIKNNKEKITIVFFKGEIPFLSSKKPKIKNRLLYCLFRH